MLLESLLVHLSLYMDIQQSYGLKLLLLFGIPLVGSNFLVDSVVSAEESRYEACKPKNCGSGPNISYPFYIHGNGTKFCGYPGFKIHCEEGRPIFRTSAADYVVQNISYENRSFRLVNLEVLNTTCPTPLQNYSFDRSSLDFSPYHADILFFYNCSSLFSANYTSSVVNCSSNPINKTIVSLVPRDENLDWTRTACDFLVAAPVHLNQWEINQTILDIDYVKLLKDGFSLNWLGFGGKCAKCQRSGGRCGLEEVNIVCYCPDGSISRYCNDENDKLKLKLGLGIGIGGSLLILTLLLLYAVWHQRKRRQDSSKFLSKNSFSDTSSKADPEGEYLGIPIFSYNELREATKYFCCENELGDGGFGAVYYGKLPDGREVAVKRLYEHNYRRVEQFMNEVQILTGLRHKNLVSLYGCTSRHSRQLLLVYEYISNGTVADHLHGELAKSSPLTWPIRMSIALETACALAYLHASGIIHRDVKTNNILLDDNFCVKVADFGISRLFPNDVTHVSTVPQGSPGYVDPEYHKFYQLTDKSDVYSFGVVLIELISAMPAVDITRDSDEINLSNLAVSKIQERAHHELIDPCLRCESDENVKRMATAVAELAFQCLQQKKEMRPSMEKVLEELKRIEVGESKDSQQEMQDKSNVLNDIVLTSSPSNTHEDAHLKEARPPSPMSVTDNWYSACSTSTTGSV